MALAFTCQWSWFAFPGVFTYQRQIFGMTKKLFLLDGMALVYRAHFALIARPILTSKGVNTSALYGFTQTLLDIINKQQPTHVAVAFDTDAPTQRHADFADYKATREAMPEDLSKALPHVRRMLEAFRIPAITCDGFEADDLIGTLVCQAEKEDFTCYMVTPDKDFGQLISDKIFLYKPGRMGDSFEILGVPEICSRWGIKAPGQVADILALMGDTSDNIPGVPGIGEKTAIKLISQFGSVEELLNRTSELSGRVKESLEKHRDQAVLSKKLATIICDAPCVIDLESLRLQEPDKDKLRELLIEFEFNSIGKRLLGDDFRAGRGFQAAGVAAPSTAVPRQADFALTSEAEGGATEVVPTAPRGTLQTLSDVEHRYTEVFNAEERKELTRKLLATKRIGVGILGNNPDRRQARVVGFAFASEPHTAFFVPVPQNGDEARAVIDDLLPVLQARDTVKVGHDLKPGLSLLKWQAIPFDGPVFDTMVAHALVEPDVRHTIDYLSESILGYTPVAIAPELPHDALVQHACEHADLALQLSGALEPLIDKAGQRRVLEEIELPLMSVLVAMEHEGIKVDAGALEDFAAQLSNELADLEKRICQAAGTSFNLNSPRQLGQILFEVMKICEAPKKTRTGQYATDEQTLLALAPDHEVVRMLLEHRAASKLKSTYADALPQVIWPTTARIHTTYNQVATATGRLNSQDPNLQNIPIRSERGKEIRKAFVPRDSEHLLLSADYSQIELRIIAALSREPGLLEAFRTGADVHTATAARVYGVFPEMVTPEMRSKAKMVNYGLAYGMSAFGLAQRLGIPRREASEIIDQYFRQFAGVRRYMDETIAFARKHGYAETVTGRRRYLRDITSSNNTVRSAAERNAINAPIQGTAADMIKVAMINVQREIERRKLRTRMLLQVHDELVFDLYRLEEAEVRNMVEEKMKTALPLEVPIEVEIGVGKTWLEAH